MDGESDPLKTFSVIQTKLTVGEPGDKYEQEADRTAAQIMRMPDPQADEISTESLNQPQIQRMCSKCEAEEEEEPSIQMKEGGDRSPSSASNLESRLASQSGKGSALPESVRSFMEPRFGNDFSGVRVHTDSASVQMNKELGAQAFTYGNDIYFNSGKYNPGSSGGQELLAHELTHTVQQTGGVQFKPEESQTDSQAQAETPEIQQKTKGSHFLWRMVQTKMGMLSPKAEMGSPDVQAKCSQCESEETIQRQSISPLNSGDSTIQTDVIQDGLGLLGSGIDRGLEAGADGLDWAGDRAQDAGELVGEGLERLADFGVDTIADLVALRSPELADLIRQGPIEALKETVGEGIKDWFDALLEELGISDIVEDFSSSFDTLFETVRLVMEGDPETCDAVANKLNSMTEFVKGVMDNPKVQALQDAFTEANEVFQQILDTFVAPVFNTVMDLVGDALSGIVDFGRQIWEWGAPVRDALKEAWDWVLEQLGIGGGDGESEGGLIDWIKEKAGEAWESIKETLDPVIEPIRTVVMVAAALSPITWIAAAVMYAPQVIEMVRWLWENRNNPNIVESAHEEMGHTILPDLLSGMQGFGDGLASAVDTIIEEATKISDGFISLVNSITGLPLLSMIKGTMETISDGIKDFVSWSRNTFKSVSKSVVEFAQKIQEKIRPWIDVLVSIGGVLINPAGMPGLLLGQAWMALPDCYKGPIIDFLLETLIEILGGMPDFPFFGILWPFLKQGVLGFLQGLLSQSTDVKVAISNKIARIIGGSSPDFVVGFVKGFLRGIWEGLTDPFALIYDAVTSINDFKDWLNRSEEEGRNQSANQPANQPGSTTSQQPGSTQQPNSTTQGANSSGGRGGAGRDALQEAGMSILEMIIDRLITMAGELEAPSNEVTTNFLSAVQEVFTGAGEDITFEDVMNMMGEVQGQVMTAIGEAGGQIATQVCEFMMQDGAESQIGDAAGWLSGTIVLELVIAYFTAGASTVASSVVKTVRGITNVLDRSGPAMRMVSNSIKTLGRHMDEILGSIRKLLNKAGDQASKVMDNIGVIGDILRQYGDELLELLMGGVPIPGGRPGRGAGGGPDASSGTPEHSSPQSTASGVSSTPGQSTPQGTAGAGSGSPGQSSPHNQEQNDSTPGHTPTPGPKPTDRDADSQQNPTPGSHPSPTPGSPHKPGHHGSPSPTPGGGHPDRPKKKPDENQDAQNPPHHPKDKDNEGLTEDDRRYHQILAEQAINELERIPIDDYDTLRKETEEKAEEVERRYTNKLKRGIRLRVYFENAAMDRRDEYLNFRVVIAPNTLERSVRRRTQLPRTHVTYGLDDGKAGWVKADPLTKIPGNTKGSEPTIDIPGWSSHIMTIPNYENRYVKLHLLSQKLHGPGNKVWNLTPGRKSENTLMEQKMETPAHDLVTKEYRVLKYEVRVTYRTEPGYELFAESITLRYEYTDEKGKKVIETHPPFEVTKPEPKGTRLPENLDTIVSRQAERNLLDGRPPGAAMQRIIDKRPAGGYGNWSKFEADPAVQEELKTYPQLLRDLELNIIAGKLSDFPY
ncbi:MAG: DUF4157 domain-containing protein [Synechococcales bacterium]|nr:DUF4157 domain-containing protein [Synechococcales bacterium]